MSDNSVNSKRIAKNTALLYIRMIFLMLISLYTSRVVLEALGVEDYGIYNVVGGVVAMFTSIATTLSTSISRFITFELGGGDQNRLRRVFLTSLLIQLIMSVIIIVLVETIGLWFLEYKMIIPLDRIVAAKSVLHLSTVALVISLISIPFNATIVAHERMAAFAYISIFDAVGKLLIAYFIVKSPIDSLVFYSVMISVISLFICIIYVIYCNRNFHECRKVRFIFDRLLFKEMFSFAGWNFIGTTSSIFRDQGGNILLNIFCGPAVNAARGVAIQVSNAITSFSTNFMTALNPQITKSYASGDMDYMMKLIFQGSRLSFYLLLMLSLPIIISTSYILNLWLIDVPTFTVIFVQLVLVFGMCDAISKPLITAMFATGNIKSYQITVGAITILNLPISYVLLKLSFPPFIIFVVSIFITLVALFVRIYMLRSMIGLSMKRFIKDVLLNILLVSIFSFVLSFLFRGLFNEDLSGFIIASILSVISTLSTIYFIGCNRNEKVFVNSKFVQLFNKIYNR